MKLVSLTLLAWIPLAVSLKGSEIFSETFSSGYTRGKLVGQKGWVDFDRDPSSPVVYDTEGSHHSDFSWAVVASKPTSADDWAVKSISAPVLNGREKVVVEIAATRVIPPQGGGSAVMFGYGGSVMDKVIGLSNEGVYFRDGWGRVEWPVDASGGYWNDYDSKDVVSLRATMDLQANTVSLAVKNHTRGETEYTPLFFDAAQTQSTVDLGSPAPWDQWSQVFLRITGAKGSMIFRAKVSVE